MPNTNNHQPQLSSNSKSVTNIFEALKMVEDTRDTEGRRHHLAVVLLISIMSTMSGYFGVLAKGDFINRNRSDLEEIFDPELIKHGLPSKNTIDRVMQRIDYDELNSVLSKFWNISPGDVIHLDGKAIRSTIEDSQNPKQTFTSIVTAFAKGQSIQAKSFTNGSKKNEISTVQELVKALNLEGMVLTLDALHCQKKQ